MLHVLKELKVLSNQSITISAEVREGGPGYMKNFIKHSDAQLILSFLDLPLMGASDSVRALMGQPHQTGAIAVDDADDDIVMLDDVSGNANSAHARHPLAPLDMNAGLGVIQDTQSQNYQNTIHVDDGTAENGSRGQNLQAAAADLQIARCPSGSDFAAEGSRRFTVKRLKSLEQKDYENMSHAQCSLVASKASKALAAQAARAEPVCLTCSDMMAMRLNMTSLQRNKPNNSSSSSNNNNNNNSKQQDQQQQQDQQLQQHSNQCQGLHSVTMPTSPASTTSTSCSMVQ